MTTATLTARRNQNLYRQPAKLQLGPTSATFVVVALTVVLSLLYLNQITKTGTFTYKATSTSEVLSFFAVGTPTGVPPFVLLDGVSLNASVPEPETLTMMATGLVGMIGYVRYRVGIRK